MNDMNAVVVNNLTEIIDERIIIEQILSCLPGTIKPVYTIEAKYRKITFLSR